MFSRGSPTLFLHAAMGCVLLVAAVLGAPPAAAGASEDRGQTIVHLLDYVSVDYPETVSNGAVQDAGEYQEQREFATRVLALLGELPAVAGKETLVRKAQSLVARIDARVPGAEVSAAARDLAGEVIQRYQLTVAPRHPPDLSKAASLFRAHCAACHGGQGRGDGPASRGMDPAPGNFHDAARMDKRSIHGLYNTVTLGVAGTPMRAFTELAETDRWALAFFVGGLRHAPAQRAQGEALWRQGKGKTELGDFRRLVTAKPDDFAAAGAGDMNQVHAYLVANPAAIASGTTAPLQSTRGRLAESLAAYRAGDRAGARQLAITAYLEGFELVEQSLDNVDPALRRRTEEALMAMRNDIDQAKPVEAVEERVRGLDGLLQEVEGKLAEGGMSAATAFTSSLVILLREGLEAILVLAAIIAFVRKTGRRDALPYIHAGWIAAAVLGAATWLVASHFVAVSGASRELTEGVSALLAAAMLLYVGLWLHNRSRARAWQSFIRDQVSGALARRTLWAMAGISFLAVYRELFEVILFYETLLAQAGEAQRPAVLAGIGVATVLLALLGGLILKYGARLPFGLFFSATSWLLVAMAVIFVGHGVAAMQEAGLVRATPVDFVALPMLGVHPNAQGLAAQVAMLVVTLAVVLLGRQANRS